MKEFLSKTVSQRVLLVLTAVLIAAFGYSIYLYSNLEKENASLKINVSELERNLGTSQGNLSRSKNENIGLTGELIDERAKIGALGEQIDEVTDIAGDLQKLSRTDPELLAKYSKVFFLNENYIPPRFANIDIEDLYYESTPLQMHADVWPHLDNLIEDAANEGITLWILSAYRSFGAQSSLKSAYTVTYGSGANTFSADQGYSEHQLGTTIDFTTRGISGGFTGFKDTEAYQWLTNNAHRYGFVLSYPEGNAFYVFEPWHWRFIGTGLARELYRDGRDFYDLDQREIDKHLIDIFD